MKTESMLTTHDNPYDPFTQFDPWLSFDEAHGYATSGLLARITIHSDALSDADQQVAIDNAIDEILREDAVGIFKKVTRVVTE